VAAGSAGKRRGGVGGRTEPAPCRVLGDDRYCEPLNKVWLLGPATACDGRAPKITKRYGACTCGQRFPPGDVRRQLPAPAADHLAGRVATDRTKRLPGGSGGSGHVLDEAALAQVVRDLWPVDMESPWARIGVVPVGQAVLHRPTDCVDVAVASIGDLAARLLHTQSEAEGIGLAANQVGAPVRALAHNLPRVAPPILVNAVLLDGWDHWDYEEGCLSLHLDGTGAEVRRPKVVVVHADLLDGTQVVVEADELFARVLQHELDHLDGIEYVQRLTGREATRVYALMRDAGIDTATWLPPSPY